MILTHKITLTTIYKYTVCPYLHFLEILGSHPRNSQLLLNTHYQIHYIPTTNHITHIYLTLPLYPPISTLLITPTNKPTTYISIANTYISYITYNTIYPTNISYHTIFPTITHITVFLSTNHISLYFTIFHYNSHIPLIPHTTLNSL